MDERKIKELLHKRDMLNIKQLTLEDMRQLDELAKKWNCSLEGALVRCIDDAHVAEIGA